MKFGLIACSPQAQHGFQPAEVVEKIEQQRIMTEVQQKQRGDIQTRVGRGRRRGTSGGTSKGVVIREEGGATLAGLEDVADTGKGELIQQKPILAHHFWGVGSSSTATRHQLSNSSASVHKQQEQILMSGGNINEQYHLAESEAQKLGKLTIQALGSSSNVAGASSGMDFHLHSESPNNAQGNKTQKQRGRKKKDSPVVVAVVSSSDGKDAEVEKPVNENIQPHFSLENDNPHDTTTPFSSFLRVLSTLDENAWEGFSFTEYGRLNSPQNKLLCCDFSTTGKLLSGAGYEKKILLLNTENFSVEFIDAHVDTITDVRFRPNSTIFATSSFDKTVQVWDASKRKRLRSKLDGHPLRVMSLDFHPMRTDLLYSCDSNNQMRIWNFQRNTCTQIAQGLGGRLRFQPRYGDFLASSMGNLVNLIDVETNTITNRLEGHLSNVRSLCWDTSGKYIVSVSEDSARIWTITSGGRCVHHLLSRGNAFESCTFHPGYSQLTVIGMNEKLELWNPTAGNRTRSYDAHAGLITALADSPHTETIASASHDGWIKLWR